MTLKICFVLSAVETKSQPKFWSVVISVSEEHAPKEMLLQICT